MGKRNSLVDKRCLTSSKEGEDMKNIKIEKRNSGSAIKRLHGLLDQQRTFILTTKSHGDMKVEENKMEMLQVSNDLKKLLVLAEDNFESDFMEMFVIGTVGLSLKDPARFGELVNDVVSHIVWEIGKEGNA